MHEAEKLYFRDRESFRNWLQQHHDRHEGFWMIYYKKHTGKTGISYDDALEEALCFGWIDSLIKKTDEERYVRKFTPRKDTSNWSERNIMKFKTLVRQGKMTPAGYAKIDPSVWQGSHDNRKPLGKSNPQVPQQIRDAFAAHEPALANFRRLAPSYQRQYVSWITSAKRKETIEKRIKKAISMLKENRKPGLM